MVRGGGRCTQWSNCCADRSTGGSKDGLASATPAIESSSCRASPVKLGRAAAGPTSGILFLHRGEQEIAGKITWSERSAATAKRAWNRIGSTRSWCADVDDWCPGKSGLCCPPPGLVGWYTVDAQTHAQSYTAGRSSVAGNEATNQPSGPADGLQMCVCTCSRIGSEGPKGKTSGMSTKPRAAACCRHACVQRVNTCRFRPMCLRPCKSAASAHSAHLGIG